MDGENTGTIFVSEGEFYQSFKSVAVCFIDDDYHSQAVRLQNIKGDHSLVEMTVGTFTEEAYLVVSQPKVETATRLIVGRVVDEEWPYEFIDGVFNDTTTEVSLRLANLTAGKYIVYSEFVWDDEFY